ncbi:MAG: hypothetical protein R3D82_00880 [Xanthobacteraceae bacterium]
MKTGLFKSLLIGATGVVLAFPAYAQAPRALYNKTVQVSWSVAVSKTGPDGSKKNTSSTVYHTVYVSSTGRLFERASRANRKRKRQTDNAPGATQNAGGEATGLRFEGNRLVGNTAFAEGARRWVVSFDPGFSSCTVAVTFGREAGKLKRKGIDGVMYTIDSIVPSAERCSIREGNPFS